MQYLQIPKVPQAPGSCMGDFKENQMEDNMEHEMETRKLWCKTYLGY